LHIKNIFQSYSFLPACLLHPVTLTNEFSAASCDHFGRHGELKKYLATKILAKVVATYRLKEKRT